MQGNFSSAVAEEAAEKLFINLDKDMDSELTEVEFVKGAKSSRTIMDLLQAQ